MIFNMYITNLQNLNYINNYKSDINIYRHLNPTSCNDFFSESLWMNNIGETNWINNFQVDFQICESRYLLQLLSVDKVHLQDNYVVDSR